jgi:hypothetical protein
LLIMSITPSMGQRHRWLHLSLHLSGVVATSLGDSCYHAINFAV